MAPEKTLGDRMQEQQAYFEIIPRKKRKSIFGSEPAEQKQEDKDADKSKE